MTRNRKDGRYKGNESVGRQCRKNCTGFVDGRGVQRPLRKVEFNKLSNKTLSYWSSSYVTLPLFHLPARLSNRTVRTQTAFPTRKWSLKSTSNHEKINETLPSPRFLHFYSSRVSSVSIRFNRSVFEKMKGVCEIATSFLTTWSSDLHFPRE